MIISFLDLLLLLKWNSEGGPASDEVNQRVHAFTPDCVLLRKGWLTMRSAPGQGLSIPHTQLARFLGILAKIVNLF